MGFANRFKRGLKNTFKKNVSFKVIGGENYLTDVKSNMYIMYDESKEHGKGVVDIEGEFYYFLGAITQEQYQEGKKRTISGAIIGGAIAGGVGAIIGSQTRKKSKDISTYFIELANYRNKERFTIQVESSFKNSMRNLSSFRPINPKEIGLSE